ncbi:MAG: cupin domain-containing protein [Pseudomonadota bacterium]|jgi:mannose-6-phosphate isomerase-like protein (cupin superfamily)|uniref:Cupin type-2 domain-containing protein n=1 Tax=hydrothermal vent metagenome TaxID=652676 RepID=A0A160TJE7_9ZZZZ
MADEKNKALREMARHRGLTLKTSRRRKPGGDFGCYGLVDAAGKPVLGIGAKGLEASAGEVETFLRDAMRATWKSSAGTVKVRKIVPEARPEPAPKPKPKLKIAVANLFAKLPAARRAEAFTGLLDRPGVRIERIVSNGQATPEDEPMVQEQDEWVVLLKGEAGIRIEDSVEVTLRPGDHLTIPGGQRHWVTYTAKGEPTVWLAVHIG